MKKKLTPEKADPMNPVWTQKTFEKSRRAEEVLPEIFGEKTAQKMLRPRGRPKSENAKIAISLRLPQKTLARWKATGPGWQTRMAEALKRVI